MLPTRQLCGTTSTLAYLVLLRVEIARFTQGGSTASGGHVIAGLRLDVMEHPEYGDRLDSSLLL